MVSAGEFMTALKDIIAGTAGVSHLAASPLWEQDMATSTPAQLIAFVANSIPASRRFVLPKDCIRRRALSWGVRALRGFERELLMQLTN